MFVEKSINNNKTKTVLTRNEMNLFRSQHVCVCVCDRFNGKNYICDRILPGKYYSFTLHVINNGLNYIVIQ